MEIILLFSYGYRLFAVKKLIYGSLAMWLQKYEQFS